MRSWVAACLEAELLNTEELADQKYDTVRMILQVMVGYMKNGSMDFSAAYATHSDVTATKMQEKDPTGNEEQILFEGECRSIAALFAAGNDLYVSEIPADRKDDAFDKHMGFAEVPKEFMQKYPKKGPKVVSDQQKRPGLDAGYAAYLSEIIANGTPKSGGLFGKLFGKK